MKLLIILTLLGLTLSNTFISSGLTPQQKQMILDKHNQLRQLIASGNQANQPKASNMKALNWDAQIAQGAQDYADKMIYQHSDANKLGENLAQNTGTYDPNWAVQAWYDEVKEKAWNPSFIDALEWHSEIGHFTQIVWAKTYLVGCGYVKYKDSKNNIWNYVVCQYKDQGNYIGSPIYAKGNPCSSCGDLKCNSVYTALCGGVTAIPGSGSKDSGTIDNSNPTNPDNNNNNNSNNNSNNNNNSNTDNNNNNSNNNNNNSNNNDTVPIDSAQQETSSLLLNISIGIILLFGILF